MGWGVRGEGRGGVGERVGWVFWRVGREGGEGGEGEGWDSEGWDGEGWDAVTIAVITVGRKACFMRVRSWLMLRLWD